MANETLPQNAENKWEKQVGIALFALALLAAVWFRFHEISLKPFHHDEGVNSYFLLNLARDGNKAYQYNPLNYHGPSLYYLTLLPLWVLGETDLALRFWPALCGVLTVLLLWWLRRELGYVGLAVAALLIALSPGLIFFSRYFIHEMLFGFFSLGIVVGARRYAETKHFAWLALLAVSAGLLFATKETAIITVVVFLIALLCAAVWDTTRRLLRAKQFTPAALVRELKRDWRGVRPSLDHALSAVIIFVFINVFLYSSAFTNWKGVGDAFSSIMHWTRERSGADHVHPFYYYLGIIFKIELPLLIGALLAGVLIVWRGTRFWLFTGAWTLGLVLGYSLIPYKTPWLLTSFLIPMALVSGYAAEQLYHLLPPIAPRLAWGLVLLVTVLASGQMAQVINFEKYEDNSNSAGYFAEFFSKREFKPYVDGQYGYVYAQTDKDFLEFVKQIHETAERLSTGKHTGIYVASPDYWPLPWYLHGYDKVAYAGSLPEDKMMKGMPQKMLILKEGQVEEFREKEREERLRKGEKEKEEEEEEGLEGFKPVGRSYTLRPGVQLLIYAKDQ